jgi:hypothetical protein
VAGVACGSYVGLMTQTQMRLALALSGVVLLFSSADAGSSHRPVVVELFTSQGCSSCPPADALLGRLSQRREVLAISLPITYWDMLGWKDTLASETNTRRQKAYAHVLGRGGVYTPQMIVDGVDDVVGSREADVETTIARHAAQIAASAARLDAAEAAREARLAAQEARNAARDARLVRASVLQEQEPAGNASRWGKSSSAVEAAHRNVAPLAVPVMVQENPTAMHIAIGAAEGARDTAATVWLYHLRNAVTVNVGAGENEGRTMTYHNVVGDLRSVGKWSGEAATIDVPRAALAGLPHDSIAVVVQEGGGYGQVVGATLLSHPDYDESH